MISWLKKMKALASISAIPMASPRGFRTDASVLLQEGRRQKGNTCRICCINPKVKAFAEPSEELPSHLIGQSWSHDQSRACLSCQGCWEREDVGTTRKRERDEVVAVGAADYGVSRQQTLNFGPLKVWASGTTIVHLWASQV